MCLNGNRIWRDRMEENKITFENIQKANDTIKTTGIERRDKDGNLVVKNYAEVNQRIKAFRMVYPTGTIETEMSSNENGVVIFRANVYDNEDRLLATGTAYEKENSTFINKTSYIENCETSAIGRALGIAGFGIDTSVASAEEVQNAINNQEVNDKPKTSKKTSKVVMIQDTQKEMIKNKFTADEIKAYLEEINKPKLSALTVVEASNLLLRKVGNENE